MFNLYHVTLYLSLQMAKTYPKLRDALTSGIKF